MRYCQLQPSHPPLCRLSSHSIFLVWVAGIEVQMLPDLSSHYVGSYGDRRKCPFFRKAMSCYFQHTSVNEIKHKPTRSFKRIKSMRIPYLIASSSFTWYIKYGCFTSNPFVGIVGGDARMFFHQGIDIHNVDRRIITYPVKFPLDFISIHLIYC